ncbi:uncharacterized protein METZ01_LOCUS374620, partial [marine metagenome]
HNHTTTSRLEDSMHFLDPLDWIASVMQATNRDHKIKR